MGSPSELRVRLVEALRKAEYPPYLTQTKLGELIGQLDASLAPIIAGYTGDGEGEGALGGSRLGGQPDLPEGMEWPCAARDGEPLAFIAQLNLAELAGLDAERRLPARGMWYLFSICGSDEAYGGSIDEETTAVLHVPAPTALAPRAFPEALAARARLQVRPLRFVPSLVCESFDPKRNRYTDVRFDGALEKAMRAALAALGSHAPELRVLGHATFFQRDIAELYDPARELELLGFAGALASPQFGEGEFHVVIDRDALAKGALGAARVIFEPGT